MAQIIMQRPFYRFWSTVEEKGCKTALFRWKMRLEHEYDILHPFLRPTAEKAVRHDCPFRGHKGCPRIIEKDDNGDVVAICNSTGFDQCKKLKLAANDIVIHEVDWYKLCEVIADILNVEFQCDKLEGFDHTFKIGDYIPMAHKRYPVYLSAEHKPENLKRCISRLCNMHNQGDFLLICLVLKGVERDLIEVSNKVGATILYLNDILVMEPDGILSLALPPDKVLEEFHNKVMPVIKTPAEKSRTDNLIPFLTPPGTLWGEISIKFTTFDNIIIGCKNITERRHFSESGMYDTRSNRPTKQWDLLYEFALKPGGLNIPIQQKGKFEKRKQLLTQDLHRLFPGMAGEPIANTKRGEHTYKSSIMIYVGD